MAVILPLQNHPAVSYHGKQDNIHSVAQLVKLIQLMLLIKDGSSDEVLPPVRTELAKKGIGEDSSRSKGCKNLRMCGI